MKGVWWHSTDAHGCIHLCVAARPHHVVCVLQKWNISMLRKKGTQNQEGESLPAAPTRHSSGTRVIVERLAKDLSSEMLQEIVGLVSGVGFDVKLILCCPGLSPLAHAAFKGHEASVRLLLEGAPGINVNQRDSADDRFNALYRRTRDIPNIST